MPNFRFFVEGPRDEDFIRQVVLPLLGVSAFAEWDESVVTYSGLKPKTGAGLFYTSLKQGYASYILADLDPSKCIMEAKRRTLKEHFDFKGLRRPPDLQRRILVVCPEIEAWYLAGVVSNNSLGIPAYSSTDSLTYEEFKKLCQQLGRREEEVYPQILNEYDWNLAKTRNRSLLYFATRFGL